MTRCRDVKKRVLKLHVITDAVLTATSSQSSQCPITRVHTSSCIGVAFIFENVHYHHIRLSQGMSGSHHACIVNHKFISRLSLTFTTTKTLKYASIKNIHNILPHKLLCMEQPCFHMQYCWKCRYWYRQVNVSLPIRHTLCYFILCSKPHRLCKPQADLKWNWSVENLFHHPSLPFSFEASPTFPSKQKPDTNLILKFEASCQYFPIIF